MTGVTTPTVSPDLTLASARQSLTVCLQKAGLPDAALDARIFVEDATGLGRAALSAAAGRPIGPEAAATLERWLARRLAGEPVFRIVGRREFWGLDLKVTPDVLDPRPDTETIVAAALEALEVRDRSTPRICDLGTGSGAILAALLHERPQALGWAIDRSHAACLVARENLDALGLGDRAVVLQGNWAASLPPRSFDLVVSNPPYIETGVIPTLDREVRDHDPALALDGGPDGLACYRLIAADLARLLVPEGVAVLEVGAGQCGAVHSLLAEAGLIAAETRRDLGGHERAVIARCPPV